MKTKTTHTLRKITGRLAALLAVAAVPSAFAASQTWTNAPQNGLWNNTNNWIARAIPGALNSTGNGNNNDTATFNSPLFGGIGGAGNPIVPDDATTLGARARSIGSIVFDTADVGAYVFQSPSPAVLAATGVAETGYLNVGHNNAIRLNAAVTNSQLFLVPLKVLLPSSTAGIFNLVNNSTNPSATLTISSIMHAGATSRATTFVLDGVNTGNNIVTNLSEGGGNATGGFTKQGSGTWIVAGTGTFPGASPLNITAGTLITLVADAFGAATTATVTNTGVLQINGITPNQIFFNLRKGGTIRGSGAAAVNGVVVGTHAATTATLATLSASDVFTVGTGFADNTWVGGGAADSVLNTAGPGTLVFGQNNTYIGNWAFGAATNQITNPSALGTNANANANVNAGAILDLTPLGASAFVPTIAGFGGSGTGTVVGGSAATVIADAGGSLDLSGKAVNLVYTPSSFSGDLTRPALYIPQGGLTLGGNTFFINNVSGTPLGVGTYRLIQSATAITSGGGYAALVNGSGMVGGAAAAIQISGGNVDLVISIYTPKNLVWSGSSANWDLASSVSWLDGASPSVFNTSDNVTFNSVGLANPNVNLSGTLAPATVVVDTSANDYTLGGSGQIAGTTSLKKLSAGVLNLQTVNSYAGGTVVSNGTLRVGNNNAISSTGAGGVEVYGAATVDLNNFANTINGLSGNGSVDNQGGSTATLTVGNNNASGVFSGVLKNTSGTLALAKIGNGSLTLSSSNSYGGGSTLNGGTLVVGNAHALGTNTVTVNGGVLDMQTDLHISSLAGAGGNVANNTTASTLTLLVEGGAATTYSGAIINGSGSGSVAVKVLNGSSLTLGGINTFTGGTFVGANSSFFIPNSPASVGGFVVASNGATLGLSGGSGTPGTPTNILTASGATVNFTAGALGKIWGGQFEGAVNTTNRYFTTMSFGGDTSFKNFLGLVRFESTNGSLRFINIPAGTAGGSDNTTFEFSNSAAVVTRDAATVRLGHIIGGSQTSGIDGATTAGVIDTYMLGGKGLDSTFLGYFRGSNNLVKIGAGQLIFAGANVTTNTDSATYTNYLYASLVAHTVNTTVSNGVLGLVVPNNLSNSPVITLSSASAVLDVSKMGFVQDFVDESSIVTNQVLVTNGVIQIHTGQTLAGIGSVQGAVVADAGSVLNLGLPTGTLAVSGSVSLNGAVNVNLDRAATPNSGRLTAASFAGSGAVLTVTNLGATLVTGDTFQLFNGPVSAFTTVNLPVASADNSITYAWENNLAVNGTIKVLSGASPVNPNPTNITTSVTGNQLTLSWPASHTGWTLQAQTNALTTGLSGVWYNVAGSTTTNQVIVPINPANPTVFYRLTLPLP